MSVEGHVDRVEDGRLLGWAWLPDAPEAVLEIEVRVSGAVMVVVRADGARGDLETAGKRGGLCAFEAALGMEAGEVMAFARTASGPVPLPGGPLWWLGAGPRDGLEFDLASGVAGHLDRLGPQGLDGWARRVGSAAPVALELVEGGRVLLRFQADGWRRDLEEARQGDGRWGFSLPAPAALFDGETHRLDLRVADRGPSVLSEPVSARFPKRESPAPPKPRPPSAPIAATSRSGGRLLRHAAPELSVIVLFHDMRREAERTLASLTRGYQRGAEALDFEVIAIDNGSPIPLDPAWVKSFGPEFRLWRPEAPHPSPCAALNAAARQARGTHLAVMIDGAHLLTPGVFEAVMAETRRDPQALVALRHWFIGGDQRWLAQAGYRREQENVLFARIAWPKDGYELFRIGAPIGENPNAWLEGLSESNCLVLPAATFAAIGGFDERFDLPGGGFANLDLLRRAADAAPGRLTCLLGEATFHQYHAGTTTNVPESEMERRVERYSAQYRRLRGRPFEALPPGAFRISGAVRTPAAAGLRQRPLFPAPLGVTQEVRPGGVHRHLDPGAQAYLQSAYAELGLWRETRWLGRPVGMAPADVLAIQEVLHDVRPGRIVTNRADPGFLGLLDSLCRLLALDGTAVVLAAEATPDAPAPARVALVQGDPFGTETARRITRELEAVEEVVAIVDPPARSGAPTAELALYAGFVTFGSYLVVLDTVFGQPWLGYSSRWRRKAIRDLTRPGRDFAVDPRKPGHLVSTSPSGYLRRIGPRVRAGTIDPSLDQLAAL